MTNAMSAINKSLIPISIFTVINMLYSFVVSYIFTVNWKDFVETFTIMNFVFFLQLTVFPIGIWHEKKFLLYRKTKDAKAKKLSVRSSIILLVICFVLEASGIFIAGFTTPKYYGPLLALLKMISVILALFGLLFSGLILHRELEKDLEEE